MKKTIITIIVVLFFASTMHAQNSTKVYPDFSGKWIVNSKIENPIGIDSLLNTVEGDTLQSIIIPVKDNRRFATPIKAFSITQAKKHPNLPNHWAKIFLTSYPGRMS